MGKYKTWEHPPLRASWEATLKSWTSPLCRTVRKGFQTSKWWRHYTASGMAACLKALRDQFVNFLSSHWGIVPSQSGLEVREKCQASDDE